MIGRRTGGCPICPGDREARHGGGASLPPISGSAALSSAESDLAQPDANDLIAIRDGNSVFMDCLARASKLLARACRGVIPSDSTAGGRPVDRFGRFLIPVVACAIGCSLIDRQEGPQILSVTLDREPQVGRRHEVTITLVSDDPDNDELDFRWVASGGHFKESEQDTLIGLFQDSISVVWVAPSEVESYDLMVEVGDGRSGAVATSSVNILVTQAAPTADAGTDQVVAYREALKIVLDGTGSFDPDGDLLRFRWGQVGGPAVNLEQVEQPSFSVPAPGGYLFSLNVIDDVTDTTGALTSNTDEVAIQVTDPDGSR